MKYQAILFDLDGTLLPMDMHDFTKGYFKLLFAKLAKHKPNAETFAADMWAGVAAMVQNDGTQSNESRFWEVFAARSGMTKARINADCLAFYGGEFDQAKAFTGENPLAKAAVDTAHRKAPKVALATNPLFPMVGQETRMRWLGLAPADFDLVTSYESDSFCKPDPRYYESVCARLGAAPSACLMIGNDEEEDMYAAAQAGLDTYLVTDCRIPSAAHPWCGAQGSFADMLAMLRALD